MTDKIGGDPELGAANRTGHPCDVVLHDSQVGAGGALPVVRGAWAVALAVTADGRTEEVEVLVPVPVAVQLRS